MSKMMEKNRKAEEEFQAFNAKITELSAQLNVFYKAGDFDNVACDILAAQLKGLEEARDARWTEHRHDISDMAPEWDGD